MKVAIVHDWLVSQRGGENVVDALCSIWPTADVFTLLHKPGSVTKNIESHKITTSFLQKWPGAFSRYRHFLPFMPWAMESFDLSSYDLVVSSSHCVAKGVRTQRGNKRAKHLSYVHAPMRYMWDRFEDYFGASVFDSRYGFVTSLGARLFRPLLQAWDVRSAQKPDRLIANSHFIAGKIKEYYGRDAQVIHPFCDLERFLRPTKSAGSYYLVVSALVQYKRVDEAIETFRKLHDQGTERRLCIVGEGPDEGRLRNLAMGLPIEFLGAVDREKLPKIYADARALIFPGIEDFGIVPLEAMASGLPIIAYGYGGVLETVNPDTAVLFGGEDHGTLLDGVQYFEKNFEERYDFKKAQEHVKTFSRAVFQNRVRAAAEALFENQSTP